MAVARMTSSSILLTATGAVVVLAAALMAGKFMSVGAVLATMALAASIMVIVFPLARTISLFGHMPLAVELFLFKNVDFIEVLCASHSYIFGVKV